MDAHRSIADAADRDRFPARPATDRRPLVDTRRLPPFRASPHARILVVDIETTPDFARLPAGWDASSFPKPAFHVVRCVSYLSARIVRGPDGTEAYVVERCVSGGDPDWDELRLLEGFWRFFSAGDFRLVTWNGRRFDASVLRMRALLHGIAVPAWHRSGDRWSNYASRYAGWHLDVMEALSDHGASGAMGLDETAVLLGLPGKIGGHGSDVATLVAEGRIDAVRAYCEADVLNTYATYLRWAWHGGLSTASGHDESVDRLAEYLAAERARPHFGTFLDRWTRRRVGSEGAGTPAAPAEPDAGGT